MARCDSYAFGECTYGMCFLLPWVQEGWGDATNWLANASASGLSISATPVVGSLAIYRAGSGYSPQGHVGVVTAVNGDGTFILQEMNFTAWDQWDDRRSDLYDIEGFILPPGVPASPPPPQLGGGGAADIGGMFDAWDNLQDWFNNEAPNLANAVQGVTSLIDQLQQ